MSRISIIVFYGFLLLVLTGKSAQAAQANCKLTTRISFLEGGRVLKVTEVHARSRDACREEASLLAVNDEPERIRLKKVSFSFRDPSRRY